MICYATREAVAACLDAKLTTRVNRVIDDALAAATGSIDGLCHRTFRPALETRDVERTAYNIPAASRLWLPHGWELAAVPTSITAGGETVAVADVKLWPASGPPYNRLDIKQSSASSWWDGDSDLGVGVTVLWGYRNDETAAGTVTEALDASETSVDVSDSSAVGIGDLIRVDSERMTVTGKTMLDTGQLTTATLDADVTAQTVGVGDGTVFTAGETVLVGAEKMVVDDVAGNTLVVERGVDGTTVAAHSTSTRLYAPRTLAVTRGAAGTTAATHTSGSVVYRHVPPALVQELATEEALTTVLEKVPGVSRVVGRFSARLGRSRDDATGFGYGKVTDERREAAGQGLEALRFDCYRAHGRKARSRSV